MSERTATVSSSSLYEHVLRDVDRSQGRKMDLSTAMRSGSGSSNGMDLVTKQSHSTLASPPRPRPFEAHDGAKVSPLRSGRLQGSALATGLGSQTPPAATTNYNSSPSTANVHCATPTNFEYHLGRSSALGQSSSHAKPVHSSSSSYMSTLAASSSPVVAPAGGRSTGNQALRDSAYQSHVSRDLVQTPRSVRDAMGVSSGIPQGTSDLTSYTPRSGALAQVHERAELAEAAIFPSSLDPLETKRLHRKIEEKHRCLDILAKAPASFPQELRHYFAGKLDEEWVVELLLQRLDLPESVWVEWCTVAATEGAKYPFVIRQQQRRLGFTALL